MSEFRVASRYAKSLLELAEEKGLLEEVHDDMLVFSKIFNSNRDFELFLKNPIIQHLRKRDILMRIFKGKVNDLTLSIFDITARKNREAILGLIAREFHHQYNVIKGIEIAKVTTTMALDDTLKTEFERIVKDISHKKVELLEEVDKDIIGGFKLKIGDKQIDQTLQSKIKELELKFKENPYVRDF